MKSIRFLVWACTIGLVLLLGSLAEEAAAQTFPSRAVKIVVPYPAGGGVDVMARALAQELSIKWGQPVIIDNRGGAAGIIGTQYVASSQPDGETILATVDSPFTSNPYLFRSLPYDVNSGFSPIIMMVRNYNFILAHPSFPANDLKGLIELAKKEPGKLNFGSYGIGSHPHLLFSALAHRAGLSLVHVPYKGVAPMLVALLANEVPLAGGSTAVAGAQLKAGSLKALAYAGPTRSVDFPDVPTTAEQGFPGLLSPIWYGLFVPARTPPEIVSKINADVKEILSRPEFVKLHVTPNGQEVVAGSPEDLALAVKEDGERTGQMAKEADIKPQ